MKKQYITLLGILGLFSVVFLSSCGKGDSSAATTSAESATTAGNATTPATSDAPDKPSASSETFQTTKGTFKEIQWGDYAHFVMVDDKGEEVDFWIAGDLPNETVEKYESSKAKGTKIEIKWRTVTRNIPESGGEMELNEVFEVNEI